jgi:hypothetical protein
LHVVILAGQQEAEEGKRFDRVYGGVSIYTLSG